MKLRTDFKQHLRYYTTTTPILGRFPEKEPYKAVWCKNRISGWCRALLLNLANKLLGTHLGDDTLIVGTSGRYEFKNIIKLGEQRSAELKK